MGTDPFEAEPLPAGTDYPSILPVAKLSDLDESEEGGEVVPFADPHFTLRDQMMLDSARAAQRFGFYRLLDPLLWPDESVKELKELALTAIIEFLPSTSYAFELIVPIVQIHWQMRRLRCAEQNIIAHGKKGNTGKPPAVSLDARYSETLALQSAQDKLIRQLGTAIKTYRSVYPAIMCD